MSSRSEILSNIKTSKPSLLKLPEINIDIFDDDTDLLNHFKKMVESVGGNVLTMASNKDLFAQINLLFPDLRNNYSTLKEHEAFNTITLDAINDRHHELEHLDILVLEGLFGVAENGAIWIPDSHIPIRVLPFIAKHLVIVLNPSNIYANMHRVYEQLSNSNFDFGVFISGPSKTADIEQSLVIGAQGALSMTIFLKS